jgi:hypothetical protein
LSRSLVTFFSWCLRFTLLRFGFLTGTCGGGSIRLTLQTVANLPDELVIAADVGTLIGPVVYLVGAGPASRWSRADP